MFLLTWVMGYTDVKYAKKIGHSAWFYHTNYYISIIFSALYSESSIYTFVIYANEDGRSTLKK